MRGSASRTHGAPLLARPHAVRTCSGHPKSSMRFSTPTAMANSVARRCGSGPWRTVVARCVAWSHLRPCRSARRWRGATGPATRSSKRPTDHPRQIQAHGRGRCVGAGRGCGGDRGGFAPAHARAGRAHPDREPVARRGGALLTLHGLGIRGAIRVAAWNLDGRVARRRTPAGPAQLPGHDPHPVRPACELTWAGFWLRRHPLLPSTGLCMVAVRRPMSS